MKVTLQIVLASLKVEMDLVANLVTDDLVMPLRTVRTMLYMKDLNDQYKLAQAEREDK